MEYCVGRNKVVIQVDEDDVERLGLDQPGTSLDITSHGYVRVSVYKGKCEETEKYIYIRNYLHRLVMDAPKGVHVDHISRDRLDCRKSNLRLANNQQNCWNAGSRRGLYKGVHQTGSSGGWASQITHHGKVYGLGTFNNPHDAANAYNKKAQELYGEYAYQNKIIGKLQGDSARRLPRRVGQVHGTYNMYDRGCRCERCRTASAQYRARLKGNSSWQSVTLKPKDAPKAKDTHGTAASYKHGKCRCDPCRIAYKTYQQRFYK